MQVGVDRRLACALLLAAGTARAEPSIVAQQGRSFEASGFVGVGWFSDRSELGNSWAPEQVPNTAPVVGARVGWLALPELATIGERRLRLAVEAEVALATAFTGGSNFEGDGGRMVYFAPVFGWRAHAVLALAGGTVAPHLVAGAGGETVASSSPFMAKETDPVAYWGPGVSMRLPGSERWQLRVDLRHGVMAARDTGLTSTIELQVGIGATFGGGSTPVRPEPEPIKPVPEKDSDSDSDGDGFVDSVDRCPSAAETVNGIADDDGCPEADPDGDRIFDAADQCPDAAEDRDGFEDEDGCPDPDNDGDGLVDAVDSCPLEPETKNGIADADGCADTVPADVTAALAVGGKLVFEPFRARVTTAASKALQPVLAMLAAHREIRIVIVGHPRSDRDGDLANRRAEAVKWFLVDAGIAEDRIVASLGATGTTQPQAIEIVLAVTAR